MTVPINIVGLVFFIVMLWPGLTYISVRERRYPSLKRSTFREAIDVVSASLGIASVIVGIFCLSYLLIPRWTPKPDDLLFDTRPYVQSHLPLVLIWTALAIALSQLAAVFLGHGHVQRVIRKVFKRKATAAGATIHESRLSAWWLAFNQYPVTEAVPYVGCQLEDGSFVSGMLHSYARLWEDSPDRDLILRAPIRFRPAKSSADKALADVGMVVVSARNIQLMTVSYMPSGSAEAIAAEDVPGAGSTDQIHAPAPELQ
jgi:hypothetical protein